MRNSLKYKKFCLYFLTLLLILQTVQTYQPQFWWDQEKSIISIIEQNAKQFQKHADFNDISFKYHMSCETQIFQCQSYLGEQIFDKLFDKHFLKIENLYRIFKLFRQQINMKDFFKSTFKNKFFKLGNTFLKFANMLNPYNLLIEGLGMAYDWINRNYVEKKCQQLMKQILNSIQAQMKQKQKIQARYKQQILSLNFLKLKLKSTQEQLIAKNAFYQHLVSQNQMKLLTELRKINKMLDILQLFNNQPQKEQQVLQIPSNKTKTTRKRYTQYQIQNKGYILQNKIFKNSSYGFYYRD